MFGRSKKRELKAAETLAAEVKAQREVTQELVERYEQRTKKTVQAIEAASKAREERDEYRRVLAAAIASERRQELHVAGLERELKEVKESVLAEALRSQRARTRGPGPSSWRPSCARPRSSLRRSAAMPPIAPGPSARPRGPRWCSWCRGAVMTRGRSRPRCGVPWDGWAWARGTRRGTPWWTPP